MQPMQSTSPTQSPLDNLADIHLPDGVSHWPLAPGWWGLIALTTLFFIAFLFWKRHRNRNRYRHLALDELKKTYHRFSETKKTAAYLQEISLLLRRTALSAYPKTFNASIKGEEWVIWLDNTCPATKDQFTQNFSEALILASYQKEPQVDVEKLQQLCELWIKKHNNVYPSKKAKNSVEAKHV